MEKRMALRFLGIFLWLGVAGCGPGSAAPQGRVPPLQPFDNGAFSMQIPAGWNLAVAGDCTSLAFVLQDPREPLRKILYFGLVGPVYQSQMQRQIDYQCMQMGAMPIQWFDMPVVDPLTPENLLSKFSQVASSRLAQQFMPGLPRLDGFQVISSMPQRCFLNAPGAMSSLVRGLFVENGRVAQGLFSLTTAPFMPSMGGPGGGTAYGYMLTGITAPKGELDALRSMLMQSLASFSMHPSYVQGCMARSDASFQSILRAGRIMSETSDRISRSWEERNRRDDIMAEKGSDAILGKERLYDPGTGEVYEFQNGFYDQYRLNPEQYRNSQLQPLPDGDAALWGAPTLDGSRALGN